MSPLDSRLRRGSAELTLVHRLKQRRKKRKPRRARCVPCSGAVAERAAFADFLANPPGRRRLEADFGQEHPSSICAPLGGACRADARSCGGGGGGGGDRCLADRNGRERHQRTGRFFICSPWRRIGRDSFCCFVHPRLNLSRPRPRARTWARTRARGWHPQVPPRGETSQVVCRAEAESVRRGEEIVGGETAAGRDARAEVEGPRAAVCRGEQSRR